ncbi:unnamed protein product, partial [Adineta steineri]
GIFPTSIASGDLNNDQKPDLIVTNGKSNDAYIFLNNCPK